MRHQALYWEPDDKTGKIRCCLCPHQCLIAPGKVGICRTRKNVNQTLISVNYGKIASIALDPIEKKPFYHYKPGTGILSVGTYGCNMRCLFCQNYSISQEEAPTTYFSPEDLIDFINKVENNIGIAFTYNEPMMWYEYVYDAARLIKEKNRSVSVTLITNGYINAEPLKALLPYIDAMNIDLKSFSNATYRRLCGARLEPVLSTIRAAALECHVEITTLIITDENDSLEEIKEVAKFISGIDRNIPLHLSRYYPTYKLNRPATPHQTLLALQDVAKKHLNYVYIGNISGGDANTYCPKCGKTIVERRYYQAKVLIDKPECPKCGELISLIM
ncbi:MAG: AmmeMemoRadiSam system radical SAM enzyme [Bacilli bacterium]|nr:AmmeMemoRadiSam system radical SAM enzyme [Bacilli bacterium]MDD4076920.1 AmmeMemoRadiSam system radical SAM enzyme [Bacilli bacterium]MDD4388831.1 AmmeMemoRadiSam system radical SAM enzyme [Bacilli bacterium]